MILSNKTPIKNVYLYNVLLKYKVGISLLNASNTILIIFVIIRLKNNKLHLMYVILLYVCLAIQIGLTLLVTSCLVEKTFR